MPISPRAIAPNPIGPSIAAAQQQLPYAFGELKGVGGVVADADVKAG